MLRFDLGMNKRKKEKEEMGLLAQHTWPFTYGFFIVEIKSSCRDTTRMHALHMHSFCSSDFEFSLCIRLDLKIS